jgi:O-antigen ligase
VYWPFGDVRWTLALCGLLLYSFIVITYRIPGATYAIGAAAVGVLANANQLRFPPFLAFMAGFVIWAVIGYGTAFDPVETDATLTVMVKVLIITIIAVNALKTPGQIRFYMVFYLAAYAIWPIRGTLINYYLLRYNTFGRAVWNNMYENPNDLAAITFFPLSLCFALLATEKRGWVRYAAFFGTGICSLVILLTQSRGAFIALAILTLLSLTVKSRHRGRIMVGIVVGAIVVAIAAPKSVWQRLGGLANATSTTNLQNVDPEGSAESRFNIWRVASRIINDHPATGVGLGGYRAAHRRYAMNMADLPDGARGRRDTHSTYINVAAETGYPGLFLWLAMIIAVFVSAERERRRRRRFDQAGAIGLLALEFGLLAYLLAGIFGSFAKVSLLYLHLALIAATTIASRRMQPSMMTQAVPAPSPAPRRRALA